MDKKIMKVKDIKLNPNNPRLIKDARFKKLVRSIQDFPKMLMLRPIVINEDNIVLGGNMRLRACIEAGFKEVPVLYADNLTEEEQKEFIVKDNIGFGEWDWEDLANKWNTTQLIEWGIELPEFKEAEVKEEQKETVTFTIKMSEDNKKLLQFTLNEIKKELFLLNDEEAILELIKSFIKSE